MRLTTRWKVLLLTGACVLEAACSSSQVLVAVEASLNAVAALQAALPTLGVSPQLSKEIANYATAAATGVGQCSALLAAGGDTTTLVAKCGQFLSAAVQPVLPPGTPQQVAGLINTVYAEIQVVYGAIESAAPPTSTGKASLAPRGTVSARWTPTKHQSKVLLGFATKAMKMAGKA